MNLADLNYRFRELVTRYYIIPEYRFHEKEVTAMYGGYEGKIVFNIKNDIVIYDQKLTSKNLTQFWASNFTFYNQSKRSKYGMAPDSQFKCQ